MSTIGLPPIGQESIAETVLRDPPTVIITAPGPLVTTSTITVNWTYNSAIGRPQTHYRVVLQVAGTSIPVDTGLIPGSGTSHVLDYQLSPFVNYRLFVGVHDGLDGGQDPIFDFNHGWDDQVFFTEFSAGVEYPDHPEVGSVYEIAIDGVGYMLADGTDQFQYKRQTAQLVPERLATGNTPFSEAIERYTFIAHSDWRAGEGQRYLDRPDADPSRYFYSEWVDPFEPGEISLLQTPAQNIASTYVTQTPKAVVANGDIYLQTGSTQLTALDVPGGTPIVFSTGNPGPLFNLASDGTFWYATDGAQIRRNNTAADPLANWSTVDVTDIEWCSDRLAGLDTLAVPPNFTTFTDAGAEENVGGWQSFPGASLRGLCGGDGFIWFGVNRAFTGEVRAYRLGGAAGSTIVALTVPEGELVDSLYYYLGNVMLATRDEQDVIKIYRCVASEGRLTPQFIVATRGFNTQTKFAGKDRLIAFTWQDMIRSPIESGIGVLDLETGGYARWYAAGGTAGFSGRAITDVVRWAGDFGLVVQSSTGTGGFYGTNETPAKHAGFLETSVSDLASNVTKVLDAVTLTTRPLAGSVEVQYSTSSNDSWTSLGMMSGSGSSTVTLPAEVFASSFGFKLILTPAANAGPVIKLLSAKTHTIGIVDQLVVIPVNCANRLNGLNQRELPEGSERAGVDRVRRLESLTGNLVRLQDIDWPVTRTTSTFQVVSTELTTVGQFDRHLQRRVDSGILVLTLRRASS